jgi:hypothetical protein
MLTYFAIGVTGDASGLQRAMTASVAVSKADRTSELLCRRRDEPIGPKTIDDHPCDRSRGRREPTRGKVRLFEGRR